LLEAETAWALELAFKLDEGESASQSAFEGFVELAVVGLNEIGITMDLMLKL
jgi:hypothetical protein